MLVAAPGAPLVPGREGERKMRADNDRSASYSRRRLLGTGITTGAGVAALALTGCGDDDDSAKPAGAGPTGTSASAGGSPQASPSAVVDQPVPGGEFVFSL